MSMDEISLYTCPSCGETIEISVDPSGGQHQEYVEDCPVCCRPNVLRVDFDRGGMVAVESHAEVE